MALGPDYDVLRRVTYHNGWRTTKHVHVAPVWCFRGVWERNMSRYTRYVCVFKIRWGRHDDSNNDNNLNDLNDNKRCTRVVLET